MSNCIFAALCAPKPFYTTYESSDKHAPRKVTIRISSSKYVICPLAANSGSKALGSMDYPYMPTLNTRIKPSQGKARSIERAHVKASRVPWMTKLHETYNESIISYMVEGRQSFDLLKVPRHCHTVKLIEELWWMRSWIRRQTLHICRTVFREHNPIWKHTDGFHFYFGLHIHWPLLEYNLTLWCDTVFRKRFGAVSLGLLGTTRRLSCKFLATSQQLSRWTLII